MNEYQSVPHQMTKGDIASFARPATAYRSLWISDFHLGTRGCKAGALHSFLRTVESDNLYLVGDIVDGWNLGPAWYWSPAQNDVVTEIVAWQRRGTRVVFVPGNHDQIGLIESLLGISAHCGELIHVTASGCRMLVTHGHQFDSSLSSARWLALMGSKAYGAALRINEWYFRECFGRERNTGSLSVIAAPELVGKREWLTLISETQNLWPSFDHYWKCGADCRAHRRLSSAGCGPLGRLDRIGGR